MLKHAYDPFDHFDTNRGLADALAEVDKKPKHELVVITLITLR